MQMVVSTLDPSSKLFFFKVLSIMIVKNVSLKVKAKKSSAKALLTQNYWENMNSPESGNACPSSSPPALCRSLEPSWLGLLSQAHPQKSLTEQVSQKQAAKLRLSTTTLTGAVVHDGQAGPTTVSGRELLLRPTGAFQRTAHRRRLWRARPCCCCWSKSGSPVQTTDPRK